jgi:hypothetical protein
VLIVDLGEKFWLRREGKLQVRKCGNDVKPMENALVQTMKTLFGFLLELIEKNRNICVVWLSSFPGVFEVCLL